MIPIALLLLGLLALVAPILHRMAPRLSGPGLALGVGGLGVTFSTAVPDIASGAARALSLPWSDELGVALSFRLDGLAVTFALLICFIGAFVLLYASSYLAGHARLGRFYGALIGFMAAMLGLVLADNLILLFVFWELTSVASFVLIGFEHERASARRAAVQALLITGLGGLVLLAGLVLLGVAAGTFEMSEIGSEPLRAHPLYVPTAILILVGAFSKSAVVPFHFWLPNAMEAPSPVSALLHSSTMVKAGVYLVARLHPALGGTLLWDDALIILGGATMVIGAFVATRQGTLKRILAYSTVSSLGALMMLIGMGAAKAAAVYLLAHAMFKGGLFLVAGSVTRQTGQKDPEKLGGLGRCMPVTAGSAIVGSLSMAGMFPLAGFVGKELVLKAGLAHPEWAVAATSATVLAAALTVMAACLVGLGPFFRASAPSLDEPRQADWRQLLGPLVLAAGGIVAGIAPALFAEPLVRGTIESITGSRYAGPLTLHVADLLWPPSTATALSVVALVAGGGLYLGRARYRRLTSAFAVLFGWRADRMYDAGFDGLGRFAQTVTRVIQNGRLRSYVRVTLLMTTAVVGVAVFRAFSPEPDARDITVLDAVVAGAIMTCAIAALLMRAAMAAIAVVGGIGFLLALFFVLYGAPDVAMTQFAVETLIVMIFVLVIYHFPRLGRRRGALGRGWDGMCAGAFGVVMGAAAYAAATRQVPNPVSELHAARSVPEGFGRNVVNVILVDFRALDTMGEIFVLGIAAVGVYTLLRLRVPREREASP